MSEPSLDNFLKDSTRFIDLMLSDLVQLEQSEIEAISDKYKS